MKIVKAQGLTWASVLGTASWRLIGYFTVGIARDEQPIDHPTEERTEVHKACVLLLHRTFHDSLGHVGQKLAQELAGR